MTPKSPMGELIIHIQSSNRLSFRLIDMRGDSPTTWTSEPERPAHDGHTPGDIRDDLQLLEDEVANSSFHVSSACYEERQNQIGVQLGTVLFGETSSELDARMNELYQHAKGEERFVRILLLVELDERKFGKLNNLPWEATIWPRLGLRVGTDPHLALSRTRTVIFPAKSPDATRPLDVLMTTSHGRLAGKFRSAHRHIARWLEQIETLSERSLDFVASRSQELGIGVKIPPSFTRHRDVFYYLGHGAAEGIGWLEPCRESILSAGELLQHGLFKKQIPPLMVLLTCESDICESTNLLDGKRFADQLIEGGAPVVLSMFGPLDVRAAPALTFLVQSSMQHGVALDRVMQHVRWYLYEIEIGRRDAPFKQYGKYKCKNWYRPIISTRSSAALESFVGRGYLHNATRDDVSPEILSDLLHAVLSGLGAGEPLDDTPERQLQSLYKVLNNIAPGELPPLRQGLTRKNVRSVIDEYEEWKWYIVAEAAVRGIAPPPVAR